MSGADVQIATFERGETERLCVALREYQGHHFIDVRVQFRAEDGEWRPTKKGITIKMRELHLFSDAIGKACELAKAVRQ